jgi:nucleoside 2-deoxyribosyltransferase-like protein
VARSLMPRGMAIWNDPALSCSWMPPMNLVHAGEAVDRWMGSIFLAGPSPRRAEVRSWRPDALAALRELSFTGTVLVPEPRNWSARFSYLDQVEWEYAGLEGCSVIVFWVPRDLDLLPGFTTNVEFGRYVGSGRCVYGRPHDAPHTKYLDWLYRKRRGRAPENTLSATMAAAVEAVR